MRHSNANISIVIPAFNEEKRIGRTLDLTVAWAKSNGHICEVLVVDDGSTDGTSRVVSNVARVEPIVSLITCTKNRGKGAAVRRGMDEAIGEYVLFMDADFATPLDEIPKLLSGVCSGADIAIGSRKLPGCASDVAQPCFRRWMGDILNRVVRSVFFNDIRDTQCGFKLFRRSAAREIFRRQVINGYAFDIEILWLARILGYVIEEVPVRWYHRDLSKVSPIRDALKMSIDMTRIWIRSKRLQTQSTRARLACGNAVGGVQAAASTPRG